jgi:hypothetical protein
LYCYRRIGLFGLIFDYQIGNDLYLDMRFHSMNKKIIITGLFILSFLSAYAQKKSDKSYYEDLSVVRSRVVVTADSTMTQTKEPDKSAAAFSASHTVNAKVDFVLDSISRFNLLRRSVDGYTIQVYSGQKREDAMNARKKVSESIPDLTSTLQYQQPKFRVTIGKYYTKLEAYQDLSKVRAAFPSAILIPEKIAIR